MTDLKDIAYAIKVAINAPKFVSLPRPYLGMSQLGHKCARSLWMYFRWAAKTQHKAKSQRIFDRGKLEEERVIGHWKNIGIKIVERQSTLVDCGGHLKGHTDGILQDVPGIEEEKVIGEIKTMSQKYFTPLVKKGLKEAAPAYYAQDQIYMHYENANYCLHSTTNKNDEDLHIEIIPYDAAFAETLVIKAADIIFSNIPPKKISTDPSYFECRWCDFYGPCQLNDPFLKTCRTCSNVEIVSNGRWECLKHEIEDLSLEEQEKACSSYNVLKV